MAACNTDLSNVPAGTDDASGSSGSDSGSTEEEERLRRLFTACDRDGDGYIDRSVYIYLHDYFGYTSHMSKHLSFLFKI